MINFIAMNSKIQKAGIKAKRFAGLFCVPVLIFSAIFFAGNLSAAGTVKNYDQRIKQLERLMQNQSSLEMFNQLQSLQREVSALRGEMEVLNHELGEIKQQQKDIYLDVDQRLVDMDQRLSSGSGGMPLEAVPSVASSSQSGATADRQLSEQEAYQSALAVLKSGKYDEAIEAFQIYLISFPESEFASNAQYWMAEAYYVLKNYQSAISQFTKVINAYPNSRKVPDAYLKMGFSFYEIKDWQNAQQALEVIMAKYPASTAARLAQSRLQKMARDGRIAP